MEDLYVSDLELANMYSQLAQILFVSTTQVFSKKAIIPRIISCVLETWEETWNAYSDKIHVLFGKLNHTLKQFSIV